MISKEFAFAFAKSWIDAWNAHDLEKIMSHYSEDFVIESPMAVELYAPGGMVVGKAEVRKYWATGLQRSPELRFELLELFIGVNSIALYLLNASSNKRSVEVMRLNDHDQVYNAVVAFCL